MSPRPILYGLARSVYTRIARLALEEKSVDYALEEVEIFSAAGVPEQHLERHPFGRIPTFVHGTFRLYETVAITRYIDEAFPGPSLQPAEPETRGQMTQIMSVLDAYAYRPMIWGIFVQRVVVPQNGGTPDESKITESMRTARTCVKALEALQSSHQFLAGDQLSLADLHATPMFLYLRLTREGNELIESHPRLALWLAHMAARPSIERTRSVYER
ncbi:MAG: glutathione S-transferase family protein [Burkholderiales bacterium]|nr:glutathione S-transferase family protein [Burkholderiales bacterium]